MKYGCEQNRDGSYATQAQRRWILDLIANQLHELGFRQMDVHSLKPKHVEALVKRWRDEQLAVATIKNRLAALRWWARKINRQNVIARTNDHYGIPDRQFVTNYSKAKTVTTEALDKVRDAYVRMSLELQQAFGLRREEAIKFIPSYADRGDTLVLKDTWTKGGKARELPIRTPQQREILNRAHQLAGRGSLIPANRNYVEQLRSTRAILDVPASRNCTDSICLCATALSGPDGMDITGGRWTQFKCLHARAGAARQGSAPHHQPRARA